MGRGARRGRRPRSRPLKYEGLSYTEIWISEAQERMVLAVPPESWPALEALCASESVEAHRPRRVRRDRPLDLPLPRTRRWPTSRWTSSTRADRPSSGTRRSPRRRSSKSSSPTGRDYTPDLTQIMESWDVCSKEWIVRQYDHEVQREPS